MKVMVLGAAGYVGCVLCKKLLDERHDVVAVDRGFFGLGGLEEIKDHLGMKILVKDGFNLTEEDLKYCDCFINISGLSNDPMADFDPKLNFKLNTDLTEYTAKLCKKEGIKYIFGSSCSLYDFGFSDEKDDVLVDETAKVNPTKHYSLSKYEAEQKLANLADENFKPIILRKATICGYSPRMRYDLVVNTFVKDALKNEQIMLFGGGENWRPLIDIEDVCEVYSRCINLNKGGLYNVVGYNVRISELALRVSCVLRDLGYRLNIECDYDIKKEFIRNYRVDGTKLYKELDFSPKKDAWSSVGRILEHIEEINDFDNPIYYNIRWTKQFLQHWLKY